MKSVRATFYYADELRSRFTLAVFLHLRVESSYGAQSGAQHVADKRVSPKTDDLSEEVIDT